LNAAAAQEIHTMKLASPYSFDDTLSRLRTTFAGKGMTIFATIDHQAAPDFALELPLKVLVREDEPVASLEGRHGLPAGMTARLAPAEKLLAAVVQPASGH
jgi:uncharacterized protein (DUF302 family)